MGKDLSSTNLDSDINFQRMFNAIGAKHGHI